MDTILYRHGNRYSEREFLNESKFEGLVIENSKILFGQNSIYIDSKKKIDNSAFGGVIPDGFLFDLSDKENFEFYIIEIELSKHSFFNHIFPQITKYFAFYKNPDSQGKLVEKLYEIFNNDNKLQQQLKDRIGNREIFKFIKDTVENSQNILLIIDDDKQELPEIMETYTDTWGKMVKIGILKEYQNQNNLKDSILAMSPNFENIENIDLITIETEKKDKYSVYSEEFHLDGVEDNIKMIYGRIKNELSKRIPELTFNPQRYYISLRIKRNFAFLKIRKKKIGIVTMAPENKIRQAVSNYSIESLSEPVQHFYNGECARIDVTNDKHLDEIIELLIEIQK